MPDQFIYANFFATELTANITVGSTTINIPPSASFGLPNFSAGFLAPLTLWDGTNPPEIVYVTNNPQTGAMIVQRARESTSAFAWSAGTQVISTITAGVLNAALLAYNTGMVLIANYLPLSGGTLTGPLTLSGAPTIALHAATKAYVDAIGTGPFLPLIGGTMTGTIGMSAGGRITGLLTPLIGSEPATKTYTDGLVNPLTTLLNNFMADRSGKLVTAGTGLAYTLATTQNYSGGLTDGVKLAFRMHATNRASPTLSVDGTAAVALRSQSGVALLPGRLAIGAIWEAEYRLAGPEWILIGERQETIPLSAGGTLAYTLTSGRSISVLEEGLEIKFSINVANTGVTTLNVDGLGAIPLRPATTVEFGPGMLRPGTILNVKYNNATAEFLVQGAPFVNARYNNSLSVYELFDGTNYRPLKDPTYTRLLSGAGNYNPPTGCIRIEIEMVAGGGSGGGTANNGVAGNDTTFESWTAIKGAAGTANSQNGGNGGTGGATGTGTLIKRMDGGRGGGMSAVNTAPAMPGYGGMSMMGPGGVTAGLTSQAAPANSGGGGSGGGSNTNAQQGSGGGGGEYVSFAMSLPVGPIAYSVGAGGATGGGANPGGAGGSGIIVIKEIYGI